MILYELLTGTTPVDSASLRSAVFAEIQRIICDVEPPRPSLRLAQATTTLLGVATRRSTEPRKLTRTVHGELDWIVMKALEKERTRRYETANGLAMDLRRYLAAEPVIAAPPSASYRLQKFVRRNKGVVAAGSLVAAALLLGLLGFAWQARIAQARAAELEQVSKFQAEMLGQVDATKAGILLSDDVRAKFAASLNADHVPPAERAEQVTAFARQWHRVNATDAASGLIDRTILAPAVAAIDKKFKNQPVVDATMRQTVAAVYVHLGLYAQAFPLQSRALATRRAVLGSKHRDTMESVMAMGQLLENLGRFAEAEAHVREAVAWYRAALGLGDPDTMASIDNLGELLWQEGKLDEAERYSREALAAERGALGSDNISTLVTVGNLGLILYQQGKLDKAEPYFREAMDGNRRVLGQDDPGTLTSIDNFASLLFAEGKFQDAARYEREALDKRRRILGEDHPDTLISLSNFGTILVRLGKPAEAEQYEREALEDDRRLLGETHPNTMTALIDLGNALANQGKNAEAEQLLSSAEAAARKAFAGENEFRVAMLLQSMGNARIGSGKFALAEKNLLEARAVFVRLDGSDSKRIRENNRAILRLYIAWDLAEPGNGHDAKAAEWRGKVDAIGPSTPKAPG